MSLLDLLTAVTAVFLMVGAVLFTVVVYTVATGKDRRYRVKYQRFLDQRRRVEEKLRESKRLKE